MKSLVVSVCVTLCVLHFSWLATAESPVKICGLDGYDIPFLSHQEWTVDIGDFSKCYRPDGVPKENVTKCVIRFTFCRALDRACPDLIEDGIAVCESITLNNGTVASYNLGFYTTEHDFHPKEMSTYDGFGATWNGSKANDVGECSGNFSMDMTFSCDSSSRWFVGTPNVTKYLTSSKKQGCETILNFDYIGACYTQPTIAPGNCMLDTYDVSYLSGQEYWSLTTTKCIGGKTCTVFIALCHALPPTLRSGSCNGAAVCMVSESAEGTVEVYSLGHFENYTLFRKNDNKDGFHVSWDNGSYTTDCLKGLETLMIFDCDHDSRWSYSSQDITQELLHINYDNDCLWTFTFRYSGACSSSEHHSHNHKKQSPVGYVFIGIFAFAITIYLAVGVAYQYFVKGERGVRVIPNFDFWKAFVIYVLEGCRFFLDLITCFKFEGKPMSTTKVDYDKI